MTNPTISFFQMTYAMNDPFGCRNIETTLSRNMVKTELSRKSSTLLALRTKPFAISEHLMASTTATPTT
ncbi:hypothetical protein [Pseudovibrio ascidiaceicola]|uniref:hypothetical protein n=1 Tax=Pseudovibrio ascidiaceicola TaxID=285279 RepID=UPI001359AF8B|nr:hypothetical protein [Pseudovibrio ascidiaceicola]